MMHSGKLVNESSTIRQRSRRDDMVREGILATNPTSLGCETSTVSVASIASGGSVGRLTDITALA